MGAGEGGLPNAQFPRTILSCQSEMLMAKGVSDCRAGNPSIKDEPWERRSADRLVAADPLYAPPWGRWLALTALHWLPVTEVQEERERADQPLISQPQPSPPHLIVSDHPRWLGRGQEFPPLLLAFKFLIFDLLTCGWIICNNLWSSMRFQIHISPLSVPLVVFIRGWRSMPPINSFDCPVSAVEKGLDMKSQQPSRFVLGAPPRKKT